MAEIRSSLRLALAGCFADLRERLRTETRLQDGRFGELLGNATVERLVAQHAPPVEEAMPVEETTSQFPGDTKYPVQPPQLQVDGSYSPSGLPISGALPTRRASRRIFTSALARPCIDDDERFLQPRFSRSQLQEDWGNPWLLRMQENFDHPEPLLSPSELPLPPRLWQLHLAMSGQASPDSDHAESSSQASGAKEEAKHGNEATGHQNQQQHQHDNHAAQQHADQLRERMSHDENVVEVATTLFAVFTVSFLAMRLVRDIIISEMHQRADINTGETPNAHTTDGAAVMAAGGQGPQRTFRPFGGRGFRLEPSTAAGLTAAESNAMVVKDERRESIASTAATGQDLQHNYSGNVLLHPATRSPTEPRTPSGATTPTSAATTALPSAASTPHIAKTEHHDPETERGD